VPIGKYDPLFGGEPGSAERALKNMKRTYGPKKGEQVFYGVVAKRERGRGRRAPKKSGKPFGVAPNLGGRGIVGVLATWNATNVVNNAPRAVITGSNFTLFNTNALDANVFWVAIAA
jgi:hypothetical protein